MTSGDARDFTGMIEVFAVAPLSTSSGVSNDSITMVSTRKGATPTGCTATASPSPGIPRSPCRRVSPMTDCRSESRIVRCYREDFGVLQIAHALEQATDV